MHSVPHSHANSDRKACSGGSASANRRRCCRSVRPDPRFAWKSVSRLVCRTAFSTTARPSVCSATLRSDGESSNAEAHVHAAPDKHRCCVSASDGGASHLELLLSGSKNSIACVFIAGTLLGTISSASRMPAVCRLAQTLHAAMAGVLMAARTLRRHIFRPPQPRFPCHQLPSRPDLLQDAPLVDVSVLFKRFFVHDFSGVFFVPESYCCGVRCSTPCSFFTSAYCRRAALHLFPAARVFPSKHHAF